MRAGTTSTATTSIALKSTVSKQPSKMRRARYAMPLHARQALLSVHLSRDLRKKLRARHTRVAKGDTVFVRKGRFRKVSGKVVRVDVRRSRVFVEGVTARRARGEKDVFVPLRPSNLLITALVERKLKKKKAAPQPTAAAPTPPVPAPQPTTAAAPEASAAAAAPAEKTAT